MSTYKKLSLISPPTPPFTLNFIWENFHAVLYVNYKGGAITEFILTSKERVDEYRLQMSITTDRPLVHSVRVDVKL